MTTESYYKSALALPLILALFGLASLPIIDSLPSPLAEVAGVLVTFAIYGGIPYLLFTIAVAVALRFGHTPNWRRLTVFAPLYLLVLFWACAAIVGLITGSASDWAEWRIPATIFGAFVLGVGYSYALLVELGYQALRRRLANGHPAAPAT